MSSERPSNISDEEMQAIQAAKKKYMDALADGATTMPDLFREYADIAIHLMLGGSILPGPLPGCGPNPDPNNEHVKEGGWGGDTASPEGWDAVPMRDDPSLWKVVDQEQKNIAHKFASEAEAERYIKYHRCLKEQGTPGGPVTCPPGQHLENGVCVPDISVPPGPEPAPTGDGPYPVKGTPKQHTIRRAVRHYASGKPDDETIEANVKPISWRNHQFVTDITIHEMEHDDTASHKLGGTHMGTGWFDHSVGIYTGKTGLGKEEDHPSTDLYVVTGPSIGDIRKKRIVIATTYFADTNHTELWTKFPGGSWVKQCEATNLGGFNPNASTFECQLRIDGFKKGSQTAKPPEPEIHSAWSSEI